MTVRDAKESVALVLLACTAALVYNHFSPAGIALVGNWDPSTGIVSAGNENSAGEPENIVRTPDLVKQYMNDPQAVIVDARNARSYREGHIPGARMLALSDFDRQIGPFFEEVPVSSKVIVYCSGVTCSDSHVLAEKLAEVGYDNVMVFPGGFSQWREQGYEIEKGENSHSRQS